MLSVRLQLRQSQSLVLTPQLLQSIRLLQFSHAELDDFVNGEIERNPLLERAEDAAPGPVAVADGASAGSVGEAADVGDLLTAADAFREGFGATASFERDDAVFPPGRATASAADPIGLALAETLADDRPSLARHALAEVADALGDPLERTIGTLLAGHLDEAGYLRCEPEEVARALGVDLAVVDAVLDKLRKAAEPAGLFARGLADCLELQLRRKDRFDPVMQTVLAHLDLLGRRDFAALKRLTGEDEVGLLDVLAEIRRLDPKPGHGFSREDVGAVAPDVIVTAAPDGTWRIDLNPQTLPRVLMNEQYARSVSAGRPDQGEQAFLAECQASANWLVRSLDQRARTILKVTAEIVRRQDDFLVRGVAGLKPMTLMAVAEAIGMHESTVSRVTANKSIATPRGTFEMKFFFTVAIPAMAGGEAHSAESVRHRIRILVDAETPAAVLSDDDIADRLRRDGVDLARRTVAKYREALGIPSSIQRRREINARRLAS